MSNIFRCCNSHLNMQVQQNYSTKLDCNTIYIYIYFQTWNDKIRRTWLRVEFTKNTMWGDVNSQHNWHNNVPFGFPSLSGTATVSLALPNLTTHQPVLVHLVRTPSHGRCCLSCHYDLLRPPQGWQGLTGLPSVEEGWFRVFHWCVSIRPGAVIWFKVSAFGTENSRWG